MAGEGVGLLNAFERFLVYQNELRRTADLEQRRRIQARLDEAQLDLRDAGEELKRAAKQGDKEARDALDALGFELPEDHE